MGSLSGKVAVVTGASRGVGKGIALALADQGATVYVTGRTTAPNQVIGGQAALFAHRYAAAGQRVDIQGIAGALDHGLVDAVERAVGRLAADATGQRAGEGDGGEGQGQIADMLADTPVDAALFVKNVGDTRYRVGMSNSASVFSLATSFYGDPRTYGLQLRYSF